MNLEQAIETVKRIVTEAISQDGAVAVAVYIASHATELLNAVQTIAMFGIDLFRTDGLVRSDAATDAAGAELYSLLCEAESIEPLPQLGPLMWLAIVKMVLELIARMRTEAK